MLSYWPTNYWASNVWPERYWTLGGSADEQYDYQYGDDVRYFFAVSSADTQSYEANPEAIYPFGDKCRNILFANEGGNAYVSHDGATDRAKLVGNALRFRNRREAQFYVRSETPVHGTVYVYAWNGSATQSHIPEGFVAAGEITTTSSSYEVLIAAEAITFTSYGVSIYNEGPGEVRFSFDGTTTNGYVAAGQEIVLDDLEIPALYVKSANGQEVTVSATVWR